MIAIDGNKAGQALAGAPSPSALEFTKGAAVSPVELIQRQVDAYNRRDLDGFLATYSDAVRTFRMPSATPATAGKAELAQFYSTQRFSLPRSRAEIPGRTVLGNKVIDHERVWGLGNDPVEVVAVYQVVRDLIDASGFSRPNDRIRTELSEARRG